MSVDVLPERPTGMIIDLDERVYHAHQGSLSHSGAKVLRRSPAMFRHQQTHPVHKNVFDFGSAAHKMVLGVGPKIVVVEADSWRTNAAKDARVAAHDEGHIPLLTADYQHVVAMADALASHDLAMRLLSDGEPEVSAFCEDPATGVVRRGRFDWLGSRILTDYKSTVCADPHVFERTSVAQYGYHTQAPWYLDLARDLGHPAEAFAFIAQEKEPPYLVSVVDLDDAAIERGRELNGRALRMFRDCTDSGLWPGYQPNGKHTTLSLPGWAFRDDEETTA